MERLSVRRGSVNGTSHKRDFQIVMYTTGSLGYSESQLVAQVT